MLSRSAIRGALRDLALGRDDDYAPLFVCGVAGCGNTVLSALFHQKYKVAGFSDESALRAPRSSPYRLPHSNTFKSLKDFRAALELGNVTSDAVLRAALAQQFRRATELPKRGNVIVDKAPNAHMVRAPRLLAAYPNAAFVLVYREPISHVEGMRRKWTIFERACIADVCWFWRDLHEKFLADSQAFRHRVRLVSYERFVENPDETVGMIANWLAISRRSREKAHDDKENKPGFALRNVVEGNVRIVTDANEQAARRIDPRARDIINETLVPVYERMLSQS